MKFALLGTGSFGTTMGVLLAKNLKKRYKNAYLYCYVREEKYLEEFRVYRNRKKYEALRYVQYPDNVTFSDSLEEVVRDADYLVFAYPSKYAYDTLRKISGFVQRKCKIISLVKGFYFQEDKFFRISSLISNVLGLPEDNISCLSGPNTYTEIAKNLDAENPQFKPCTIVISSVSTDTAKEFQKFYYLENCIRVYVSEDVVSSEVCGALKNIVALACGMADGYKGSEEGLGINFKASMITRAMYEIGYFSRGIGGAFEKVFGISGIGDVIATSFAGRSYKAGLELAKGLSVDEVREKFPDYEIEAFQTLYLVNKYLAYLREKNEDLILRLPILEGIYSIVYDRVDVRNAVEIIINRPLKSEFRMDPYIVTN